MANYTTEIRMYGFALFLLRRHSCMRESFWREAEKGIGPPSLFMGSQRPIPIILRRLRRRRCMWVWLCFCPLRRREERVKYLLVWLFCAGISVLAYLPWLPAAVSQVSQVRESYWILPLTFKLLRRLRKIHA